jgi:hypothetical protein
MSRYLRLLVPTYHAGLTPAEAGCRTSDFGPPHVAVLIDEAEGVRIVLGSHDPRADDCPDIQVERHPNGWMIFLHPVGGSDSAGHVYFHDDGRSFVQPERGLGPTPAIRLIGPDSHVPGFDAHESEQVSAGIGDDWRV